MNNIFVIIVSYNGIQWIDKCLSSISLSTIPVHVIVVDNCSADNTVSLIKEKFPSVCLVENPENIGFGKANNQGIEIAIMQGAEYFFLLNQDACIEKFTIEKLIHFQQLNPLFGIVSPLHLNCEGSELDRGFAGYITLDSISQVHQLISRDIGFCETNFVNAAAWLLTKECIQTVGGFDPIFLHYGEDRDYCYRASYNKIKIGVVFDAMIYHDRIYNKSNSFRTQENMLLTTGIAHLKNPNHSFAGNLIIWKLQRAKKCIKYFVHMNGRSLFIEFKATLLLLKNARRIIRHRNISTSGKTPFLKITV